MKLYHVPPLAVKSFAIPEHGGFGLKPGVTGAEFITTVLVVVNAAHPPLAAIAYVTAYVPGVDVDGVIAPVEGLMERPAGEAEYVPPDDPLRLTACGDAVDVQNGDPE